MILDHSNDIASDPLKMLWFSRHHPSGSIWLSILIIPLNTCFCGIFLILGIWGIILYHKENVFLAAECFQTCILMLHAISKQYILHTQKPVINNLLAEKSKFWNLNDFNGQILTECQALLKAGKITIRLFFILASTAATFFFLQPITTHHLPSQCYIPDGWFNFLTVTFWYLPASIVGMDALFWSIGFSLTVQFKLLCHKLKLIGTRNETETLILWKELKSLVNYHNFLIDFCKKLNKLFGFVFLVQSFISIASASTAVFTLMQPGPWSSRIKFLLFFACEITEMAFYCVPVEMTVNAANEVADSVFTSKWYKIASNEFKKSLTLVIERAQIPITFSGFGLIYINIRTFLLVCKTTFSFFTYLNTVGSK